MTSIDGESFGKYRILSEIGKGGMGDVYLAQDTKLNRRVALKVLSGPGGSPTTCVLP